jgi:6-phosphogluconate dehydrogenase
MQDCDIGLIGLGVMGRNLILNMADHGYSVAGYDLKTEKRDRLKSEANADHAVVAAESIAALCGRLKKPRAVIILVPAGDPVDSVIDDLLPVLDNDDLIIDGGNSHFTDTDHRIEATAKQGVLYIGMGISGGQAGARYGPSMMPGGSEKGYGRVRSILEAAAAKVAEAPCTAYLGPGSAGHFVKMVHNGIEYGIMQLLAESYDLMHRGLGYTTERMAGIYDGWNRGDLDSYLVEITADILRKIDDTTGDPLVDKILDCADQKGTGMWMACNALSLDVQIPIPTIDQAVQMRNLSMRKAERDAGSEQLPGPTIRFNGDADRWVARLGRALYAAVILTYAQGLAQLRKASDAYGYGLDMSTVARIWRGGCIIRAALLDTIMAAYQRIPDLPNLLLGPELGGRVADRQSDLRHIVETAASWGIPAPGLMASLAYFDAYRSARLPADLIQAQRDYFGAHTYRRIDSDGMFHTEWKA